jgi:hypothetical protein
MSVTDQRRPRRQVTRFWLHTAAADNLRYAQDHPTHTDVACSQCATTVRTRHTGPDARTEAGPLSSALIDHYRFDCPAVEVTRR